MARILIAEDDQDARVLLTYLLAEAGHEVAVARDGAVAVERLIDDPPEVLVLDIELPRLDGYGVMEHLSDEESGVKVLVVTARTSEQDFERSFALGASDVMSKPFDPDELVAAV